VTPGHYGTTTFSKISDSFYQFQFISASSFDLGSYVNVSGKTVDDITPSANWTYFSYNFQIWEEGTIGGTISGSPDLLPPYLSNLDPAILNLNVPVDSDINLDIIDDHTGVDFTTVTISINDTLVWSGESEISPSYASVVQTLISGGKSGRYVIDPVSNMDFDTYMTVSVSASDLFTPPNVLDTAYLFKTQANGHLLASGLQIEVDSTYEDFLISQTYPTTSSTPFVIDYIDTSGSGISISGSYVALNGTTISSTFVSVTGSTSHYKVYFNLTPDYTTDADLLFHVQQSGTFLGNIVSRDFTTELLWGYSVCYDPDGDFKFDATVESLISIQDQGDFPTTSHLYNEFNTIPMWNQNLYGQIIGIDPPIDPLSGEILSHNTYFERGKTMYMRLEAKDYAGNLLEYEWKFTIED
jgi:hypothetical protein